MIPRKENDRLSMFAGSNFSVNVPASRQSVRPLDRNKLFLSSLFFTYFETSAKAPVWLAQSFRFERRPTYKSASPLSCRFLRLH